MTIEPNAANEYRGTYFAHWEACRIEVPVKRRFFGLLPWSESWDVEEFPPGFEPPVDDGNLRFHIRFIGTPSERGVFGHMGGCCRTVRVSEVIEFTEINK
jgi:hypothetical protein